MALFTLPATSLSDAITVSEIKVPGLSGAGCGLNSKIEELNAVKDNATAELKALTSGSGGITASISSLASQVSSSASEIIEKVNKNLLSDLPAIGLKLQDEFHSAINSFETNAPGAALTKLKEIQNLFPSFDMQKALDAAAGILPAGAIPPNAAELIKDDLAKMNENLQTALPKIEKLAGSLASSATSFLGTAQTAVSDALNSIESGSGSTASLTGFASSVETALGDASKELSKLGAGGALTASDGEISGFLKKAESATSDLLGNLKKGIDKIPAFDICTAVPNQQVINGVVEELAIPPTKPTVNAEDPTPPTSAPTPVVPVMVDKFSFPFWTEKIKREFEDLISPEVDDKKTSVVRTIPLDTSWPELFKKASAVLEPAMESLKKNNSGLAATMIKFESGLFSSTKDEDLTYGGDDHIVWDRTDAERLRRGLSSLTAIGSPRPIEDAKPEAIEQPAATTASVNAAITKLSQFNRIFNNRLNNNLIDKLE